MKSIVAALLCCMALESSMAESTTSTVSKDHLTSLGRAGWREERVGPQITTVNVMGAAFGTAAGRSVAYGAVMGEPGMLAIVDASSGKIVRMLPAHGSGGSYSVLAAKSGDVFMSSHPNGFLYRLRPGASEIENVGVPSPGVTFIWDIVEGDGMIFGACYPKSVLFQYDPQKNAFRDMGSAVAGEDYARCIVYHPQRKKLYVGIGSHAGLLEVDPATGAKRDIMPARYKSEHFVYSIGLDGDYLIARLDPSNAGFVLNLATGDVVTTISDFNSSAVSSAGPKGDAYYMGGGRLYRFDATTQRIEDTGARPNSFAKAFSWNQGDANTPVLQFMVANGDVLDYTPSTKKLDRKPSQIPGQPVYIQNITEGPDGNIYSSGYVVGKVGIYNPQTGKNHEFGGVRQAEGMAVIDSRIFFGTYPRAIISVLDTARPQSKGNPRDLFRLEEEGQDRPFGMLAVPEENKLFIGTVPGYGLLGGALTIYDLATSAVDVHRGVIPNQSVVTLAYRDGMIYAGTSTWGGLGIERTERDAKLFIWDVKLNEKIFETVPIAGKQGLSGFRFGSDGNLWGWAEGDRFVFDPAMREIIFKSAEFKTDGPPRHYWRGGFMLPEKDGAFFGMNMGSLYRIDVKTRKLDVLAKGDLELLTRDESGNLYFTQKEQMYRLVPKK